MKRSFFPFFLQTIRIHYQDPELAFYTKGVLGLLWLVQLPVALWYGAPAQFYALLGAMLLAIGVDLVPFPRQHSRTDDYVTSAVMLVCCFVLFWKASIGYFSVFFLLIYLFCNVFILGIAGSAPFSLLGLTGVMLCLQGVLVADPAARYGADFVPRLPFLFLCILGIAYIITFFIQRYWVDKAKRHLLLQQRIDAEKGKLSEMSLKVITAMYSALSSKVPEVDLHCEQVAALTQELARRMGLDEMACRDGYYAGLLHEVGTVGLPDDVVLQRNITEEQYQLFLRAYRALKAAGQEPPLVHCDNSAGVMLHPDWPAGLPRTHCMARPGIILYGFDPSDEVRFGIFRPVMKLKTIVSMVKEMLPGQSASYGRRFTAEKPTKVATLCAGYADGYPRLLSCGKGIVEIKGMPCPVLGRVCMDQIMVDVSALPDVQEGDEAILWGGEVSDSAETIAHKTDTISYEVLCGVSRRVPRVYLENGGIKAVEDWIL